MHRLWKILLSSAVIAAVATGYWFAAQQDSHFDDNSSATSPDKTTQDTGAEAANPVAGLVSNESDIDPALRIPDDTPDCSNLAQSEVEREIAAEFARFEPLVTSGATIESYRGLTSRQLDSLAMQGDSAAMAVLGAISVMRAMNLPEDQAVPYMLLEEPALKLFEFPQPLETETAEHLDRAIDWFYKSAVHGRLLALRDAGEIIAMAGGTPSELGWIPQNEYENLEGFERHALDPANVYGALAFEIAPELIDGPLGAMTAELTPGGDRQQLLLHELAWRFTQDREGAGLPPIEIPKSNAPSMEEFESLLCDQ